MALVRTLQLDGCSLGRSCIIKAKKNIIILHTMAKSKRTLKQPLVEEEPEIDPQAFDSTDEEFGGFESTDESGNEAVDSGDEADDFNKKQIAKLAKDALKKANIKETDKKEKNAGIVYVGRIPNGFYEREMKEYFGQFGAISKLRMSRNKRTGASKHFAFIEFEHP